MRLVISIALALAAALANAATVYRWVDETGTVVFGDEPPADRKAEQIEIPPANVTQTPRPAREAGSAAQETQTQPPEAWAGYERAAIIYPEPESSVRQNAGNVTVRAELVPGLRQGDQLELLMDGNPVATSTTGEFELTNVDRGTHTLVTRIVDQAGETLIESQPVRFTLHRFSQLAPRAR